MQDTNYVMYVIETAPDLMFLLYIFGKYPLLRYETSLLCSQVCHEWILKHQ